MGRAAWRILNHGSFCPCQLYIQVPRQCCIHHPRSASRFQRVLHEHSDIAPVSHRALAKGHVVSQNWGLPRNVCSVFFFKNMINFKPRQRNNRVEGVGVISNYYFIVCFGSKPRRLKGRPCNKISFTHLFYFNS